ncbi:Alpha/Beta hydrolase protein [Exophiala viscosa]|uniref:Alpha/Beta hydrolase protein n=1 Tax=Exophiala viscosa TaxID=2486360 RepID=UPI00218E5C15|nr:Alpha/Beta hydrolase protein [Exophiala viscosa]
MVDFSQYAAPAEEWLEFEKTWKPPVPPPSATPQEVRDRANQKSAQFFANVLGRPETGLKVIDHSVPTIDGAIVPVRIQSPVDVGSTKLPLVISIHGGGFFLGNLETEDPHCRQLALHTGAAVLNVNYRHASEWAFPTPVNDVWTVFNWIQQHAETYNIDPGRIFFSGVSAGANLAISIALSALQQQTLKPVRGFILSVLSVVHPDYFPNELIRNGKASLEQCANAPIISLPRMRFFTSLYKPDPQHPKFSPLLLDANAFAGLCPTSFHIAGRDPVRDEGLLLEEKLSIYQTDLLFNKVQTTLQIYPGLPHAFMSLPTLPSAAKWRQAVQQDLKRYIAASSGGEPTVNGSSETH